jgi:hypothetical protein
MTTRQFILNSATQMVVNHVKNYGVPERGLENLAWECVEGVVEMGEQGGKSFFESASDESLDGLHVEIQEAARLELHQLGIALDSD